MTNSTHQSRYAISIALQEVRGAIYVDTLSQSQTSACMACVATIEQARHAVPSVRASG